MATILSDLNKFGKISIEKGIFNFSMNHEENINNYLNRLEKVCTPNSVKSRK